MTQLLTSDSFIPTNSGVVTLPSITDNGNGTITVGSGFYYLRDAYPGEAHIRAVTIAGGTFALTDNATNYVYADYNSASPVVLVTIDRTAFVYDPTKTPVCTIYRNGTVLTTLDWDSPGIALPEKLLIRLINNRRFERDETIGGLLLADSGSLNFAISAGTIWYGVNNQALAAVNSATDNVKRYLWNGSSWSTTAVTTFENTYYQGPTGLAAISVARYGITWVYRSVQSGKVAFILLGTADYKLSEAQAAPAPSSVPPEISSTCVLIGRIITLKGATTATEVDSAFITQFSSTGATNHNDLTGRTDPDCHPATAITNTPAGTIAATTVQAALNELDTEKAPKASPIFTTSATFSFLTAGRVPFSGTAGAISDSQYLTYGPTLTTGGLYIGNTTASTSPTTGALRVAGGFGVSGAIYAADSATFGTSTSAGRVTVGAEVDAALSTEYIADTKNRDFSAATDWTGTNWKIPNTGTITDVTVSASAKTYTRATGSYITDGFQIGMTATWTGFAGASNNTAKTIANLSALVMTVSEAVTDEAAGASVSCNSPVLSHSVAGANAVTLDNSKLTAPPANGEIYQITATVVTRTAGTFNMGIGGASIGNTIGRTAGTQSAYVANVTCTSAGAFTLTPSVAWLGWIDDISLKRVTPSSSIVSQKTASGILASESISPDSTSIGIGLNALKGSVQSGCTAAGYYSLNNNTGSHCTASGYSSLNNNTGSDCTASGYYSLNNNIGLSCTAYGSYSLYNNIGSYCTASGSYSLYGNIGSYCTASGYASLNNNIGSYCTASGYASLYNNTGSYNTSFGYRAGYHATYHATTYCTYLGSNTATAADSLTNSTAVGSGAMITASNQIVLGNSSVTIVTTQTAYAVAGTKVVGAQVAAIGLDAQTDSQKITAIISALRAHGLMGPNA